MADDDLISRISALVAEEHELGARGPETAARRQELEAQLDQCWDLLRQRQAKREFGDDPRDAKPRPIEEVEHYLQ